MFLAIDASRAAEAQKTGVGWYCHHLLASLKDVIPHDVRVIVYSDQPLPVELHPWPKSWAERVLKRWGPMWSQLVLANAVLRDRPDTLFVPAHVIPFGLTLAPQGARPCLITTIHDVVFKQFPESYSARERWYADHATRLAVRHANRIIVPTEHVAGELERWYGANRERIAVVHHGVRDANDANPHAKDANIRGIHMPFVDSHRCILYVGRLEHKKNVARMVEAFSRVALQYPNLRLVLAGPPGYGCEEVLTSIERSPARNRIVTLGWVDRDEYHRLLSSATTLLFPTLGEGFGLPILEAMAAGVPVITSRGGAHEEVAGDAAVLVDPTSTDEIVAAIGRVLGDADLRATLVCRGQHRAAQFTWNRAAQQTWDVLSS